MSGAMSKPTRLTGTPEWVFRWKPRKSPLVPKLLALLLVGLGFAFILSLRIKVVTPARSTSQAASVMILRNDAQGRAFTLKADEGGPFPSRFELSQWQGMAELEAVAWEAVKPRPKPYAPAMQELPDATLLRPLELAVSGKSFFPPRVLADEPPPVIGSQRLHPTLFPLSGITRENLPTDLPPYEEMTEAGDWRFLLQLNAAGVVTECISLESTGKEAPAALVRWLRRVPFKSSLGQAARWLALELKFTNSLADGTDPR
jgi:hypothetical protein